MAALKRKPSPPSPYGAAPSPSARTSAASIPVARPRLPTADAIGPYIERIDEARRYANFGPLVTELEAEARRTAGLARLGGHGGQRHRRADAGAACGGREAGHTLPDAGLDLRRQRPCGAGSRDDPYFVDVDPDTWMLDPAATCAAIAAAPAEVGAIMPIAAFGRAPDLAAWREVREATGVPVIVDGAAAFDGLHSAPVPVTVSLHATKTVAAGEGGFVASEDHDFIQRIRALTAFGFHGDRVARMPAMNAKLSEYAAAVALASLDAWPADRARFSLTAQRLRAGLALAPDIVFQPGWGTRWISSVCVVGAPEGAAPKMAETLARHGVETRDWWGKGCHTHPAFAHCPRASLPVTDRLAGATLGLPYFIDLAEDASARIVEALHQALKVAHG